MDVASPLAQQRQHLDSLVARSQWWSVDQRIYLAFMARGSELVSGTYEATSEPTGEASGGGVVRHGTLFAK